MVVDIDNSAKSDYFRTRVQHLTLAGLISISPFDIKLQLKLLNVLVYKMYSIVWTRLCSSYTVRENISQQDGISRVLN